ncbi:uncharacterized protein J3D65DRAFT_664584 [Phyllosticta citribraziliensis]|uniref:Uncharacterized protein n=1 Tax=Phyllosticta citribraziliensis TaxID=989973 RepID=A0ABR1M4W3_9PEZI
MQKNALRGLIALPAVLGQTITSAPTTTTSDSITVDPSEYTWAGSDSLAVSEVLSCQSASALWASRYNSWDLSSEKGDPTGYSTNTDYIWETVGNYTGVVSTLCDGVPRASGAASTVSPSLYSWAQYSYSEPTPTCTYDYTGCSRLVQSFRDASATQFPDCGFGGDTCVGIIEGETNCRLDAADVKLMYWPQSKADSEVCTPASTTATPTITSVVTATSGNYTFTSPTIYLSFASLTALPCAGTGWENVILGVPAESVSSVEYDMTTPYRHTKSIDWINFDHPVPASVYRKQTSCDYSERVDDCTTVFDDDYNPQLALPTNPILYTDLYSGFANCSILSWRVAVQDPPAPFKTADGLLRRDQKPMAIPLTPAGFQTLTATPASNPTVTDAPATPTTGSIASSTSGLAAVIMSGL